MLYEEQFLSPTSDDLEHKVEVLKENISRADRLFTKIKSMQTPNVDMKIEKSRAKGIINIGAINKPQNIDEEFESIYKRISLLNIENLDDEQIIDKINAILSNENKRYIYLLSEIKLKLYSEVVLYSNMINKFSTIEEINDVKNIIEALRTKMNILDELTQEKEIKESPSVKNDLYFLTSESGNVIIIESLRKNIPAEYYSDFKKLLDGLKQCKYRDLKHLHKIPFFEVKDFKIRVIFARLSDGKILIIDAFMKKEDTSEFYRNTLKNRSNRYLRAKNYYLSNMNSTEFTEEHNDIYNEIITLLDSKEANLGGEENAPTIK